MSEPDVFVVTIQYYVYVPAGTRPSTVMQTEAKILQEERGCSVIELAVDQISPNTVICSRCNKRPAVVFGLSDNLCESCQPKLTAHLR